MLDGFWPWAIPIVVISLIIRGPTILEKLRSWVIPIIGIVLIAALSTGSFYFFVQNEVEQTQAARKEWVQTVSRHYLIVRGITDCLPDINLRVSGLPPDKDGVFKNPQAINAALLLGMMSDGSYNFGADNTSPPADLKKLNNYQNALILLSNDIAGYRVRFAAAEARQRGRMQFAAWMIAIIGAIATVFISIKSIVQNHQHGYVAVGILAIIFSALGTAAASLNGFYSPTEIYSRSERALLQLRHLHTDLNTYVAYKNTFLSDKKKGEKSEMCNSEIDPANPNDPKGKEVRDFRDRYSEILNGLGSAGAVENPEQGSNPPPP